MPNEHGKFWRRNEAERHIVRRVSTDIAIFGGRRITLPVGWTKQRLVAIFGGAHVDATAQPGEGAALMIVTILGGAEIVVPEGARVTIGGFALLGGRSVEVSSKEDGPEIRVNAYSVLGGLRVRTDR
jgi:hypothetical protein